VLSGRSCLLLRSFTPHLLNGVLGEGVITERLPLSFSFPSDSTYAYSPDSVVFFKSATRAYNRAWGLEVGDGVRLGEYPDFSFSAVFDFGAGASVTRLLLSIPSTVW